MVPKSAVPRVVVLKADRLYGDLIARQIRDTWRNAQVSIYQLGFDALDSIQASVPDMFITGVKIDDMDGLEHLEPFIETTLPILVLTSRHDPRTLELLRNVRFDGLYDGNAEGLENLPVAMEEVLQRRLYVSPSMLPHLKRPRNITLDTLTEKEQLVLSLIGDGMDDQQAATQLGLSPHTVGTHRKSIMSKLKLHHKGQLMLYAFQQGYIRVSAQSVFRPGFQRKLVAGRSS